MARIPLLRWLILLLVYGCNQTLPLPDLKWDENPQILSRTQPVSATGINSPLLLSEYLMRPQALDSITTDGPFTLQRIKDTLQINGHFERPLHALHFWSSGVAETLLLKEKEEIPITFSFEGQAKLVQVRGEFNAWNPSNAPMAIDASGAWSVTLAIAPGNYEYLLVVDGEEIPDPSNPKTVSNGMGGTNSVLDIPVTPQDQLPRLQTEEVKANEFVFTSTLPTDKLYVFWNNYLLPDPYIKRSGNTYTACIPEAAGGLQRSAMRVYAVNDKGVSNELLIPLQEGKVIQSADLLNRHDYEAMVMYFLMVDRFANGDTNNDATLNIPEVHPKADDFGGDLLGVTEQLESGYFDELGVNTIWLSPITRNPKGAFGKYPKPETAFSSYHGYWPISNVKVDLRFGGEEALEKLIQQAHARGYNVLLDYVANHVHENHPIYRQHPDWATNLYLPDGSLNTEKWDEHRLTTWFDTFLPTLDLGRPEVAEPMADSALFWLRNYGIDGFRHDATKHIDKRFWRILTRKIKEEFISHGRPIFQIGETYGSPPLIKSYINPGMLDAQFDFNMYDQAVLAFGHPQADFEGLKTALRKSLSYYGDHHLMGHITGNQDRARFISLADGSLKFDEDHKYAGWNRKITTGDPLGYRKLTALTAYMMAIPGIPCMYYGDEYGSPGGNDPDNRRQMIFDGLDTYQTWTRQRTKDLIHLRRNNLALIFGDTRLLPVKDPEVLALSRNYFSQAVVAVFNGSDQPKEVVIPKGGKAHFDGTIIAPGIVALPAHGYDLITYEK